MDTKGIGAGPHRFKAILEHAQGGGAVVMLPEDVTEAIGGRKQMRVIGNVNGVPLRSSTFPYRGQGLWLGVHKVTRDAAGADFGDELEFEITRDDSPRVLELAPELEAALDAEPALRDRFEALSFSRRRELADPIAEAKRAETRSARLEKALARLREPDR
ncbi:MAG TPA: YdeI/OmpD-associated family protein [Candidatus Dormibacteraeota bacterium]|nr:YdeI/OmpD-associated family protein [Candidatus Dormibacteraeota bacterium]